MVIEIRPVLAKVLLPARGLAHDFGDVFKPLNCQQRAKVVR